MRSWIETIYMPQRKQRPNNRYTENTTEVRLKYSKNAVFVVFEIWYSCWNSMKINWLFYKWSSNRIPIQYKAPRHRWNVYTYCIWHISCNQKIFLIFPIRIFYIKIETSVKCQIITFINKNSSLKVIWLCQ